MQRPNLEDLVLKAGGHSSPENGLCFMEAAALWAGEKHSDHPKCVSATIGAFGRKWNDDLDDAGRQRLTALIPIVVGTATTREDEITRGWLLVDWMVRTYTPAWLELAGLNPQADALRSLPPLRDHESAASARPSLASARETASAARAAAWDAARAAARDAAGDAAWAAAGDAARAAAWAAAGDAARAAARDAAGDAAWDAARDAAGDAAWDAAWAAAWAAAWDAARDAARAAAWAAAWAAAGAAADAKLKPTVPSLQDSAIELLKAMAAVGRQAA